MTEQLEPSRSEDAADDPPDYRISHLMDDVADTFADHDMVQDVAPFERGGLKPRVQNRVTFVTHEGGGDVPSGREVEDALNSAGYAWTTDGPGEYVILGRAVSDPRALRDGDRILINKRRGPFRVFRVMEQDSGPEVLQRSEPSVTAELSNADSGTDWMLVQWQSDDQPWAYVKTTDKQVKRGWRYRKVEMAERVGRIGPRRLFSPPEDVRGDVDRYLPKQVQRARDHELGDQGTIHPMDLNRVENLCGPVAEAVTPEDADLIRDFLLDMAEWHERQADALMIEDDEDKAHAATRQSDAELCRRLASGFNVLTMVESDPDEGTKLYVCDCGAGFQDRHKYPTHSRECGNEQADGAED